MNLSLLPCCCFGVAGLLLSSCQLPPEEIRPIAGALPGVTVRRAEAASGGSLFRGARELNVPDRSGAINEVARMLAGLPGSSASAFHQQQMQALWQQHEQSRGQKVRAWAATEISDLQQQNNLFYPFSGPDYLFAHELFPQADTYILCGLEPAEPLPDLRVLSAGDMAAGLDSLRTALSTIMSAGYFITTDMRRDLQATRFRGVLPVLLTFLARAGAHVESVDVVQIDGTGKPVLTTATGGAAPGLMIRFRSGLGGLKRLFYFRQDLSNGSTHLDGAFLAFVSKQGYPSALVKSASYLMHDEAFSNVRQFLTQRTRGLIQDPSGVPYRSLVNAGLSLHLYGNYRGTLSLFSQQQPDLMQAYQNGLHPVSNVNFGFGYLYKAETTCIMVARHP
jgi:hypothetical protein